MKVKTVIVVCLFMWLMMCVVCFVYLVMKGHWIAAIFPAIMAISTRVNMEDKSSDIERLTWMEKQAVNFNIKKVRDDLWYVSSDTKLATDTTLRSAIDVAMNAEKEGKDAS